MFHWERHGISEVSQIGWYAYIQWDLLAPFFEALIFKYLKYLKYLQYLKYLKELKY